MEIVKKSYIFEYLEPENAINLYNSKRERYLQLPAWALFTAKNQEITFRDVQAVFANDVLTVTAETDCAAVGAASFTFTLLDDTIEVQFCAEAKEDLRVGTMEYFRNGRKGLYMVDCIRYFAPAPRNYEGINRAFHKCFSDCSMNGYFSPPPLNFCIGNLSGWIAFGLLDLPDSFEYRLTNRLGVLVEERGGKITTKKGETYHAPKLLISFPKTEWDSISLFRSELDKRGLLSAPRTEVPQWWHRPMVVTYGDEMLGLQYNWYTDEDLDSPDFNTQWMENWLAMAEDKLGNTEFTILIDAYWQKRWCVEARADETRFADLRQFIDRCHERGHKVVLWTAPMVDRAYRKENAMTVKYGILSEDSALGGLTDGISNVDYTSDKMDAFLEEQARLFFSTDPDALNCDGLKLDFLASIRNPKLDVHYKCPENGIGVKEMYRYYEHFGKAAVKYKADVMLNGSACDPRFESLIAMNRLHDIQNVYGERELRARVSVEACPNLIVDSDGAIMLSHWVEETYLNAVVYSTPSLYYINKFHDGIALSKEKMRSLGSLLALSGKKTGGQVSYLGAGHWQLKKDGRVTAETFDGQRLFLFDGDKTMYLFSWEEGEASFDAHDYTFAELPQGFALTGGTLTAHLQSGQIYELTVC